MLVAAFWIVFLLATFGSLRVAINIFFVMTAFSAFSTLPGVINLVPSVVLVPIVLLRTLRQRHLFSLAGDTLLSSRSLGYLVGFWVVSVIVTISGPGLFSNVTVLSMNGLNEVRLAYSVTNLTQVIYLTSSCALLFAMALLLQKPSTARLVAEGLMLGGSAVLLAGVLDFAIGAGGGLDMLRTATYAIMKDNVFENIGMRRIIGFSTEASAFGALTLSYAAILLLARPAQLLGGVWPRVELGLGLALVVMTWLTTSSGAYAGLGLLLVLWVIVAFWRAMTAGDKGVREFARAEAMLMLLAFAGVALFVAFNPQIIDQLMRVLDTVLFQKRASDSYVERSYWNRTSFRAFADTYGFGVGLGSTRSSSWLVALLAGTGVVGAVLLLGFYAKCVFAASLSRRGPLFDVGRGARLALPVILVPQLGGGPSVDFGSGVALALAMMVAAARVGQQPALGQQSGFAAPDRLPPNAMAIPRRASGYAPGR